ncbi:MAG: hypothetical protein REI09_05235 [Candidatus Dactylopiibacterium sp.]|nr:hypothetical protein [Candidatus Dactylopiibacterium sp.]
MSSPAETVVARAHVVLSAALSEVTVTRRRLDAFDATELPAAEVLRADMQLEAFSDRSDRALVVFRLAFVVLDAAGANSEGALDALHTRAHEALLRDEELSRLCRGLRCTSTEEPIGVAAGDGDGLRMTASYQCQALTRRTSLQHTLS